MKILDSLVTRGLFGLNGLKIEPSTRGLGGTKFLVPSVLSKGTVGPELVWSRFVVFDQTKVQAKVYLLIATDLVSLILVKV